jgi:Mrp family chromosome partitioning ATPase
VSQIFNALKKHHAERALPELPKLATASTDLHKNIVSLPPLLMDQYEDFTQKMSVLWTNLNIAEDNKLHTVMFCGTTSAVGTTMISMNFASFVVKNRGIPTLFVEANSKRPSLFQHMAGNSNDGFCELLHEQKPLNNYTLKTSITNLTIMHAGRSSTADSSPSSRQLEYVVNECKENYPLVIFDTMPLSESKESLELAKYVDGVIMVVRANAFVGEINNITTTLKKAQANLAGIVYNNF